MLLDFGDYLFTNKVILALCSRPFASSSTKIDFRFDMEIESHVSVPGKNLVKVEFKLGTASYTIDSNKGDTVLDQLVSMKEESMKILKDFITKHNVPDDDVPDQILYEEEEEEGDDASPVICPVKPKKTKI